VIVEEGAAAQILVFGLVLHVPAAGCGDENQQEQNRIAFPGEVLGP
jgi:CHASE1-domain containing sensor protein